MKSYRYAWAAVAATLGAAVLGVLAMLHWPVLGAGPPPDRQNDMTVDAAQRREVLENAMAQLKQHYVSAEKAATVEQQLRLQLQRGDFDAVTSAEQLARRLTDTLQQLTSDRHIEVRYSEQAIPQPVPGAEDPAQDVAAERLQQLRVNFGFAAVSRLRGNIGYIELRAFGRLAGATPRIAALMALLADTGALVIDLRRCGGGDPDTVMQFASYLFDQPVHLNDIYWRDEDRTEQRWTSASVPGQRYGESRKLYLLTGADTFSGCEDFAYALKYSGRATLIGKTTGGGAHAGSPQRLGAHFAMFVPAGRPINPVTHGNWEGVGVVPDVAVAEDAALDLAQVTALKQLIAAETDADWKRRLQERLAELE